MPNDNIVALRQPRRTFDPLKDAELKTMFKSYFRFKVIDLPPPKKKSGGGTREMINKLNFATRLRRTREKAGWTGNTVASKLEMSPAAYLRYERGEVDPGVSTILKLAEIYECSVDALVYRGGEGGEHNNETFDVKVGNDEGSFQINISGVLRPGVAQREAEDYKPSMPRPKLAGRRKRKKAV